MKIIEIIRVTEECELIKTSEWSTKPLIKLISRGSFLKTQQQGGGGNMWDTPV